MGTNVLTHARELICRGREYELVALLSVEDYDWAVEQGNWFVTHGKKALQHRKSGYAVRSTIGGGLLWLHKEVLLRAVGPPPTPRHIIGDHMNGVRLDCRRPNLRWATHKMNAINTGGFITKQMELPL